MASATRLWNEALSMFLSRSYQILLYTAAYLTGIIIRWFLNLTRLDVISPVMTVLYLLNYFLFISIFICVGLVFKATFNNITVKSWRSVLFGYKIRSNIPCQDCFVFARLSISNYFALESLDCERPWWNASCGLNLISTFLFLSVFVMKWKKITTVSELFSKPVRKRKIW